MGKNLTEMMNSIANQPGYSRYNKNFSKHDHSENTVTMEEIRNLITDKVTVRDPNTGRIWAIRNNKSLEINDVIKDYIAAGYKNVVKTTCDDINKEDYDSERKPMIAAGLFLTEAFYSSFIDGNVFNKAKNSFFNVIKSKYDNSDINTRKGIEDEFITFFVNSRKSIPDMKDIEFSTGSKIVNIREEKELMRAYFIGELMKNGIVNYDLLFTSGEIFEFNFTQIDEVFRKQNLFSRDELIKSLLMQEFFTEEEQILDYYYLNDKKYFFQMANSSDLAKFLIDGKFDNNKQNKNMAIKKLQVKEMAEFDPDLIEELLSIEDLPKNNFTFTKDKKNYISRDLMKRLNRKALLRVLYSDKVKYENSLNSDGFVNLYGKLNFADLENLNENNFVNTQDLIKIIKFSNTMDINVIKSNLKNFYNIDRLEELLIENKFNKKFIENFNTFTNKILNNDERSKYFEKLKDTLKEKYNNDELIIGLTKKGFNFGKIEGYSIDNDKISDMYLEEIITEQDIMNLYDIGVVTPETINEVFGSEGIKEGFSEGKMSVSALSLISNDLDYIKREFEIGRLTVKDVLELYSMPNGIGIQQLDDILFDYDLTDIQMGELLPDTISTEKVEELFKGYYISHDELSELVSREIITREEADKYAKELASHEEYENIFNGSRVAVLTRESEGEERQSMPRQLGGYIDPRKNQMKIDPYYQEELLKNIGFDNRRLVLEGYNNSLNGYIVYPSEELGVMVFFNPDKPGNATYVMSLQQGMYFLKRSGIGKNKTLESTATKQDLRETEHVKVKNACRGWGKNIVDTIRKLSPEMPERLKNSEYKRKLDVLVSEIKTDYDRRR